MNQRAKVIFCDYYYNKSAVTPGETAVEISLSEMR